MFERSVHWFKNLFGFGPRDTVTRRIWVWECCDHRDISLESRRERYCHDCGNWTLWKEEVATSKEYKGV